MRSQHGWLLLPLFLGGCPWPNTVLSESPATGATSFYVAGDGAGSFGEAFIGKDGMGFIVLSKDDAEPAVAYYEVEGPYAMRTPAPANRPLDVEVALSSAVPITVQPLTLATARGTFSVMAGGTPLTVTVSATGRITGRGTGCKLSGQLGWASAIDGALPLSLDVSACGGVTGRLEGYAVRALTYAPASLRFVAHDDKAVLDWLLL